jgi:hypothetical protein
MEDEKNPCKSDSVLIMEWLKFPIDITEWIFIESSEIFECSPFLSHISWLSCGVNKFMEIAICLLGKSSIVKLVKFPKNMLM